MWSISFLCCSRRFSRARCWQEIILVNPSVAVSRTYKKDQRRMWDKFVSASRQQGMRVPVQKVFWAGAGALIAENTVTIFWEWERDWFDWFGWVRIWTLKMRVGYTYVFGFVVISSSQRFLVDGDSIFLCRRDDVHHVFLSSINA